MAGKDPWAAFEPVTPVAPGAAPVQAGPQLREVLSVPDPKAGGDATAQAAQIEHTRLENEKMRAELHPDDAVGIPTELMHLTGPQFLAALPPSDAAQVKALVEGRMAFPAGKAAASPYWQKRLAQVSQADPEFDAINFNARAGVRRDFTSGKSAQNIKALNTAIGHVGQLADQISGTASHGGLPGATTINAVENALYRSAGASGITKFEQTAGAVAGELTQVFRGTGGAEADIARYLSELNSNASEEQKKAAVANIAGLLKSRLDALNDQYTKGMGTTAAPLETLDPHAKHVLSKYLPGFTGGLDGGGNGGGGPTITKGPVDKPTVTSGRTGNRYTFDVPAGADQATILAAAKVAILAHEPDASDPVMAPGQVTGDSPGYQQLAAGTGDVVEGLVNNTVGLVANPINTVIGRSAGYEGYTANLGQTIRDALGLPEGDQRIGAIVQAGAGGFGVAGMASVAAHLFGASAGPVVEAALAKLGEAPLQDMAAGATAAASGEGAKQAGFGPVVQAGAMLAGGAAGALAAGRAAPAVQASFPRAAEPVVADTSTSAGLYAAGQKFGVDMSIGDAGGMSPKIGEKVLDYQIGSASTMNAARENTLAQSERAAGKVADSYGAPTTFSGIGEAAQGGIKGWKGRFDQVAERAYEAIPIKPETQANLSNTVGALENLTSKITSNPKLGGMLTDKKLVGYLEALKGKVSSVETGVLDASGIPIRKQVTEGGKLSWADLKQLRSRTGEEIGEQRFGEGTLKSDLRRLYGALSDDMEATAREQGPDALRKFERANTLYREGHERLDRVWTSILGVDGAKSAESAAGVVQRIAKEGKSSADLGKLSELRKTLKPDEWGEISNGVIRLLGQPGNSTGRNFAVDTFFRNYSDMAPEAKNLLFGGQNKVLRQNLDEFAGVMGNLAASKGTRNTSGTVAGLSSLIGYGTGGVPGAIAQALTSYGAAKLWTNPSFVRWATGYSKLVRGAAKSGTIDPAAHENQMKALGRLASSNSVIASDALGLQSQLAQVFGSTPKLAAQPENQSGDRSTTAGAHQ